MEDVKSRALSTYCTYPHPPKFWKWYVNDICCASMPAIWLSPTHYCQRRHDPVYSREQVKLPVSVLGCTHCPQPSKTLNTIVHSLHSNCHCWKGTKCYPGSEEGWLTAEGDRASVPQPSSKPENHPSKHLRDHPLHKRHIRSHQTDHNPITYKNVFLVNQHLKTSPSSPQWPCGQGRQSRSSVPDSMQ